MVYKLFFCFFLFFVFVLFLFFVFVFVLFLFFVFCSFWVERRILPLGHIVSWTSNHATYDVYSPKVVETVVHGQCYGYCFLHCV